MSKIAPLLLFALLSAGCNGTDATKPSEHVVNNAPPSGLGTLAVLVKVTGDTAASRSVYALQVKDTTLSVPPNQVYNATLDAGHYVITLIEFDPLYEFLYGPQWCGLSSRDYEFHEQVFPGVATSITFSIDCPPLVGTGHLVFSFATKPAGAPDSISVFVGSGTRPRNPFSTRLRVPIPGFVEIDVPVGVYYSSLDMPTNCSLDSPDRWIWADELVPTIVTDGSTARFRLGLTCNG